MTHFLAILALVIEAVILVSIMCDGRSKGFQKTMSAIGSVSYTTLAIAVVMS